MPKKGKKKASKKRSKGAVKKSAKKKATKKATSRPATKKSKGRSARATSAKTTLGTTLRTPDICTANFPANNKDPVKFQNIPENTTVTLYQISGDTYPFSPYETDSNGLRYTELQTGDQVTVVVPDLNQTYPYDVEGDANCPPDNPDHSVTVNS
jgi:hypothetical protein